MGKRGLHVLGIDSVDIATCRGLGIRTSSGGCMQGGKKNGMTRNSDHSCGESTSDMKEIRRSTGSTSRKLGLRIMVMLKRHCSLAEGTAIDLYQ